MGPEIITWPGGEHPFRLALSQLEGLQQKTECGPEFLRIKLSTGQWLATEVFEIMRFGLIGGGMSEMNAKKAVADAFDRHPLIDFKAPALTVLLAALYGPPDDEVGKPSPAGETTPQDETGDGSSPSSTD